MDKSQFTSENEPWWLVEVEVESNLADRRTRVGELFGWSDPQWFTENSHLAEVFDWTEANSSELLRRLDDATEADARIRWLDELIEARTKESQAAASAPEAAPDLPAVATGAASEPAAAPAAPSPPKKSIFAARQAAPPAVEPTPVTGPEPAAATEPSPPAETVAATEASATEPAQTGPEQHRSPLFARRPAAADTPAPPAADPPAAPAASPPAPPAAEAPAAPSVEELQQVVAAMVEDPNIELAAEEAQELLADPQLAANLRAEEAALEAELEAALADAAS